MTKIFMTVFGFFCILSLSAGSSRADDIDDYYAKIYDTSPSSGSDSTGNCGAYGCENEKDDARYDHRVTTPQLGEDLLPDPKFPKGSSGAAIMQQLR